MREKDGRREREREIESKLSRLDILTYKLFPAVLLIHQRVFFSFIAAGEIVLRQQIWRPVIASAIAVIGQTCRMIVDWTDLKNAE